MGGSAPLVAGSKVSTSRQHSVLVVDDEPSVREFLVSALSRHDLAPTAAGSFSEASRLIGQQAFDFILLDVRLGAEDGLQFLREIRKRDPHAIVVVITGYATVENAVLAMRLGAYDYLVKPFELSELLTTIDRALERRRLAAENERLQVDLARSYRFDGIIGRSPAMREVHRIASVVAATDATVLICGETGTGKELIARSIHLQSRRANGPWIVMNCGAVPETLLETEVFGHEKGAFTGAATARPGRFERADGGTIFLDEIGDMSPTMQVKLLRVLQERIVERVGGIRSIKVDCRVIAATNRNLYEMVRNGAFREDLYYRLSVVRLEVPALRERLEDLPMLAEHFLVKYRKALGKAVRAISPMGMKKLLQHTWPGNIRELEYCIMRAVVFAEGEVISAEDLQIENPHGSSDRPLR